MTELSIPDNPARLARPFADDLNTGGDLEVYDNTEKELAALAELERLAAQSGFLDVDYFVESGRSVILPADYRGADEKSLHHFEGMAFEGTFRTYSTLRVARIINGYSVRALCLTFDNVLMLPHFVRMNEGDLLHVPVLAVGSIDRSAA